MGLVKFKDEVVYSGPLGQFNVNPNWFNSMGEYYPHVSIYYAANETIRHTILKVDGFFDPGQSRFFDIQFDENQVWDVARIRKARMDAKEAKVVRMYKLVKVVRGRKVPIGTEGEVMWMGDKGWGMSVGLRLVDGSVVFTALKNVETVTLDSAFESEVLGKV